MRNNIKRILQELPQKPGVYFHKNSDGQIIYVGKAANLSNRVKQYFQNSRYKDPKTVLLVNEIDDIEWQETTGEDEALFLEAELIKRYQPKYNILLRDDKSSVYIRINLKDYAPSVTLTRRPLDDGAKYYGPYLFAWQIRRAFKYLRRAFPFSIHTTLPSRACLDVHLGLCPGPETQEYNRQDYIANLKKLIQYIKGSKKTVISSLEKEMTKLSKQQMYEDAARVRNRLNALKALQNQVIFGDREALNISKDHALSEINDLFRLPKPPRCIEAYDISHLQGTDTVASMVVFVSGVADKSSYRKFKLRLKGNNDFAHMQETIARRFSQKNIRKWPLPDLIIIDGGKGQLSSAIDALKTQSIKGVPIVGLAKRQEEVILNYDGSNIKLNQTQLKKLKGLASHSNLYTVLSLPLNSNIVKLLQRIRDESHRFAVSYHSTLRKKRQTKSRLDDIYGIGPMTRKKVLKKFGSLQNISKSDYQELVLLIGKSRSDALMAYVKQKPDIKID
jgi:excinuclease ABC subunit C